ncbi:MAG: hypothetical protein COU34_00405 [Candidatus Magasanikbacteria bacterium CG10_big_fil_rev_8_21_14_0_10_43_9]|nr:MAG: hypothetical protein COU34_00405 [Candidatus Magasanikbacteria bacterium CG10_big_fil_rev_8_21_14_0_10_43_9]PIY92445.1 MAG: hypothetical protein COY70_03150 [Candidatus Magasanikbacteria bacterium CG_4_10_14_0_8_um_filter_42_12]
MRRAGWIVDKYFFGVYYSFITRSTLHTEVNMNIGLTVLREIEKVQIELDDKATHLKGAGRAEALCSILSADTTGIIRPNTRQMILVRLQTIARHHPDVVEGIKPAIEALKK